MVVTASDDDDDNEADNLYEGPFAMMGENAMMVAARVDRRRMRNIVAW
jgi:hypothetical protein